MNTLPYVISGDVGAYEIVDIRTGRVAHTFKHRPDAESFKDSMNEWVRKEISAGTDAFTNRQLARMRHRPAEELSMDEILRMRKTDLVDAVQEAVRPLKVRADKLETALRRMVGLIDRVNNDLLTPDLSQFKAYIEAVALLECSESDAEVKCICRPGGFGKGEWCPKCKLYDNH